MTARPHTEFQPTDAPADEAAAKAEALRARRKAWNIYMAKVLGVVLVPLLACPVVFWLDDHGYMRWWMYAIGGAVLFAVAAWGYVMDAAQDDYDPKYGYR